MKDRLIVALDVPSVDEAIRVVERLDGVVSFFKIGYWLYIAPGVDALYALTTSGGRRLFLDAKMFDVPQTVAQGIKAVVARGASFVTVHGDPEIMRAAVEAAAGSALKVFSVTVLTNLDGAGLKEMGYAFGARELVLFRARKAVEAGCDGIIASAEDEPDRIRELAGEEGLLIATPGIRFSGGEAHDQKRVATPREAVRNGADYLVVGRPILEAADMRAAAVSVIAEMQLGWDERLAGVG